MDIIELKQLVGNFNVNEEIKDIFPYGSGHINDTYKVVCEKDFHKVNYILQRINHKIFTKPLELQENVALVCAQQSKDNASLRDGYRRNLILINTKDDKVCYIDANGNYWRMYEFLSHAVGYDVVETEAQAFQAAKAFGAFMNSMSQIPSDQFHETIPDFHNTPKRFAALEEAIKADKANRLSTCTEEIQFALANKPMAEKLIKLHEEGKIPMRVTHNDTKMNNVLLDADTDEALCVIDLDTVMPGLVHYDFGDLVRTSTSPAGEDEKDLDKVFMRLNIFKALLGGYLSKTRSVLNDLEIETLPLGGQLMTFEVGIRFLTDYLNGDIYFKTHYEDHNLVRCRTQFKLVKSMQEQEEEMQVALQKALKKIDSLNNA